MNTQVATISATPDLEIIEGQITTTSTQVAAHFNKRHDRVLRAIENLECGDDFPHMLARRDVRLTDVQASHIISACAQLLTERAALRMA